MGSVDYPLHPISVAIGAEATFVARSIDINTKHLEYVMQRASEHKGTAFIEIYQNCNIFNDGAWDYATGKETKDDTTVFLEHGRPVAAGRRAFVFTAWTRRLELGGIAEDVAVSRRKQADQPGVSLSRITTRFPEPMGILRCVERPLQTCSSSRSATRWPPKAGQTRRFGRRRRVVDGERAPGIGTHGTARTQRTIKDYVL
jgi:2-oxoglutarate ferredoxin oxidoreductase subunit beta